MWHRNPNRSWGKKTPLSDEIAITPPPQKEMMNMEYHTNGSKQIIDPTGDRIREYQDLLRTPNLSQATIDEINANLQMLLKVQREPQFTKTNEVILDDRA